MNTLWAEISRSLDCEIVRSEVHGRSQFDETWVAYSASQKYFVKTGPSFHRLKSEFDGLKAIANTAAIKVPTPFAVGNSSCSKAYLVTEFLSFHRGQSTFVQLANDLANLHQTTAPKFGWNTDNYIGASIQINTPCSSWLKFFRDFRLRVQFDLAAKNGADYAFISLGENLLSDLSMILGDHHPAASLVHGDLWSGNFGFTSRGVPVIFDPAVHYSDRETDIAMTRLFGGLPNSFYEQYRNVLPFASGWELRQSVYNLYHVLNHLNLFGVGYLHQAETLIRKLFSEIR